MVQEPWPMQYLAVPQGSTVEMNCTANNAFWAIDLASDLTSLQYQFPSQQNYLNGHGVYELPQIETSGITTLRLLINDTSTANNQTNVFCHIIRGVGLSTTLFIFSKFIIKISSSL